MIVGTGYNNLSFAKLADYTIAKNKAYCEKNGYEFVYFSPTNSAWQPQIPGKTDLQRYCEKLALVWQHLKRTDWFLWCDVDAVLLHPISLIDPEFNLILQSGDRHIKWVNTGLFLIRNCEESYRLLESMLAVKEEDVIRWRKKNHKKWRDQSVYNLVIERKPALAMGTKKLSYGEFWVMPRDFDSYPNCPALHSCRISHTRIQSPIIRLRKLKERLR